MEAVRDTLLARELLLEEVRKEHGRFVTQRIIDRLTIFHAPRLDAALLSRLAEEINRELSARAPRAGRRPRPG